jgi:hypothetical protein
MVSEAAAAAPSLRNVRRERAASSVMTGSFGEERLGLKNLTFSGVEARPAELRSIFDVIGWPHV